MGHIYIYSHLIGSIPLLDPHPTPQMASESTATVFAEARRSYEDDKDDKVKEGVEYKEDRDSEILEGLPEVNASDFPLDVIPDGGLTAWTTAFGV